MGKWEYAEELLDVVSFAIEFIIFTLFIYEESLQIYNRLVLDYIASNNVLQMDALMGVTILPALREMHGFFNNYGILALYGCNSYSHYLYVTYMTFEWYNIFRGKGRQEYSIYTTGLFGTS